MPPGIDHLMINSNDYEAAKRFYTWLMPRIGYPQVINFEQPAPTTGWFGAGGSIWSARLLQTNDRLSAKSASDYARLLFVPRAVRKSMSYPQRSKPMAETFSIHRASTTTSKAITRFSSRIPTV
jgi:catechol 2,3-dioxygenase-like lactoylglutathione lyase family enzyme